MNAFEKIKRSWWVILSFIVFFNGLGFIYIGFKNNNKNWVLEGIMYELPWIIGMFLPDNELVLMIIVSFGLLLMLVSIIRSIWVAVKLADVYDNEDKYTVRPTAISSHSDPKKNDNTKTSFGCCLCLIVIFIVFAAIAL